MDKSGQNSILIIKGANKYLLPADIDAAADDLKKCQLIILQLEISLETVYYAIEFGKKHGIPVLLNPAPATKELNIEQVCQCDFFMPNETELAILTGMPVSSLDEVEAAAQTLVDRGLKNVIVTLGAHGSLWISKEGKHLVAPFKVNAIDTSGAGDAYIGCFACCYVQTGDILSSMKTASAFAALSVTKRGTQKSYPEKEDVLKLLKE